LKTLKQIFKIVYGIMAIGVMVHGIIINAWIGYVFPDEFKALNFKNGE
jgi:hypothetical protein